MDPDDAPGRRTWRVRAVDLARAVRPLHDPRHSDRGEHPGGVEMKFLLTLYGEERAPDEFSPEETEREMAAWQAFDEAAREAGVLLACEGLAPSQTATTIRGTGGRRRVAGGAVIGNKKEARGVLV